VEPVVIDWPDRCPDRDDQQDLAFFKHESQKDKALFQGPFDDADSGSVPRPSHRHRRLFNAWALTVYHAMEALPDEVPADRNRVSAAFARLIGGDPAASRVFFASRPTSVPHSGLLWDGETACPRAIGEVVRLFGRGLAIPVRQRWLAQAQLVRMAGRDTSLALGCAAPNEPD